MPQSILIIEDDLAIQQMYTFRLQQEGYKVAGALNGQDGLVKADELRPDLILLDIRMPFMNGSETLQKLRSTEWGAAIPVIMLTNLSRTEAPAELQFLNVSRYIVKAHCTPGQLCEIVAEVLA